SPDSCWCPLQTNSVSVYCAPPVLHLHSFPTRRSSDLDDVLARLPVHGRGDGVTGGELHGVEQPQHLVEVASGAHRIDDHRFDFLDRKSTRLNSSHRTISYAVFCLKKKNSTNFEFCHPQ